jgi:hypothetical protein
MPAANSTLFTRAGTAHEPTGHDDKGRPVYCQIDPCYRCGGAGGSEAWRHTGWTCYQCGGTGRGAPRDLRLYTAEDNARLDAIAEKKRAKKETAYIAKREADLRVQLAAFADWRKPNEPAIAALRASLPLPTLRNGARRFVEEMVEKVDRQYPLSDRMIDVALGIAVCALAEADAPASRHIGTVGERQEITFDVDHVICFESDHYGWPASYLTIGHTPDGNRVVYKGSRSFGRNETVVAKWTIKEHGERDGEAQTILSRPTFPKE